MYRGRVKLKKELLGAEELSSLKSQIFSLPQFTPHHDLLKLFFDSPDQSVIHSTLLRQLPNRKDRNFQKVNFLFKEAGITYRLYSIIGNRLTEQRPATSALRAILKEKC